MDAAAAIRATVSPWIHASLNRDWSALIALCTNDVVFAPPGQSPVSGDALRAWLDEFPIIKAA